MALSNLKHKCSHIVPFKSCTFLFGHNSRNGYYQLRGALKRLVGDKRATRNSTSGPPACTTVFWFERFGRHRLELHIFGEQSNIIGREFHQKDSRIFDLVTLTLEDWSNLKTKKCLNCIFSKVVQEKESGILHARCWFGSAHIITLSSARSKQHKGSGGRNNERVRHILDSFQSHSLPCFKYHKNQNLGCLLVSLYSQASPILQLKPVTTTY